MLLHFTSRPGKGILGVCSHKVDCTHDKHHNKREDNRVFCNALTVLACPNRADCACHGVSRFGCARKNGPLARSVAHPRLAYTLARGGVQILALSRVRNLRSVKYH